MQEWYLGWEKVSYLERCPQFRSILIEREVPLYLSLSLSLDRAISEPPQPSVARKQGPTGIKTTPNAAYMEVTIAKQRQEPSEPLYEPIGDHSLWRERPKRGVLHLLHLSRSLPRHGATPTATPPQAPPTRAQSLHRLESIT